MVQAQSKSLALAEQQSLALRHAIHSGMQPLLDDENASVSGEFLVPKIKNKGRMAAQIGDVWCGAGVFVRDGSADVWKLMNAGPDGVLRRSTIVPDGHVPALLELSDHAAPAVAAGDDAAVSEVVRHLLPVGFRVEECLGRVVRYAHHRRQQRQTSYPRILRMAICGRTAAPFPSGYNLEVQPEHP